MLEFEMVCQECQYHYFLQLEKRYQVETCPVCGYQGELTEFVIVEKE